MAPRPGLLAADRASDGGPTGFGQATSAHAPLAEAAAEDHYAGTLGVGHLRRSRDHLNSANLGSTYAGPVNAVFPPSRARDYYGIGRAPAIDTSRAGRRALRAFEQDLAARFDSDVAITHVEPDPDRPRTHRVIGNIGAATFAGTVTHQGRWPSRREVVDINERVLVGEATQVHASRLMRDGLFDMHQAGVHRSRHLTGIVQSAVLAQGVQGRDVDGNPLPPAAAAKFARLEHTDGEHVESWPTPPQPRPRAMIDAWLHAGDTTG